MIPFLDLKKQYTQIKPEVLKAVEQVYDNTAFTGGKFVESFESNFAKYCEAKYAVAVNSGTSALHMAMCALNIGAGDEVIIPANTFVATAWAVSYVGATPVFVDCKEDTWEIDPAKIEEKISPKTKAIIGVHLYGKPFDIEAVSAIAKKHNVFFVEDAAQAHGATYNGKRIGSFGDLACFSFYPGKNLGTYGEGGAVTTNNKEFADRIAKLRNHASVNKYYHEEVGYNMRMGGVEGAVLDIKLKYIDSWNNRRKEIAKYYQTNIANPKIQLQKQDAISESVYHLFVVTPDDRDKFMSYMQENGIGCGMHYPVPCHLQEAYKELGYIKGDIPHSEYLADHCVSLPMFAELTEQEVQKVVEVINKY